MIMKQRIFRLISSLIFSGSGRILPFNISQRMIISSTENSPTTKPSLDAKPTT